MKQDTTQQGELEFIVNLLKDLYKKELPAYTVFTGQEGAKEIVNIIADRLLEHVAEKLPDFWQPLPFPQGKPFIAAQLDDNRKIEMMYFLVKKEDGLLYGYDLGGIFNTPTDAVLEEDFDVWIYPPEIFLVD